MMNHLPRKKIQKCILMLAGLALFAGLTPLAGETSALIAWNGQLMGYFDLSNPFQFESNFILGYGDTEPDETVSAYVGLGPNLELGPNAYGYGATMGIFANGAYLLSADLFLKYVHWASWTDGHALGDQISLCLSLLATLSLGLEFPASDPGNPQFVLGLGYTIHVPALGL